MLLSNIEYQLIRDMSKFLFNNCNGYFCNDENLMISLNQENLDYLLEELKNNQNNKYELCSTLESIYYCYSIILSNVRYYKRNVMTAAFESNPKLAQEKSVLKEKLDAIPEYAILHKDEEQLFQFLEHIQNVKNNIIYLIKDNE